MRRCCFAIILLSFLFPLLAANKVSEYTLPNGLKLLVKPDRRAPVAIFQIWYKVGGSYEPNGLTGISHVVEHMMFEGTKHYPNETFSKTVSQNGGQFNAFTSDDYTAYWEMFTANKIALSFKMEADRMQYATLSAASFNKEIQVVMEERRMRYEDVPLMMLYERLRAAAFLSNPYQHLTIGWMGDLQHLTAQNIRDWYNAWYEPNNATIVVVGDVAPKAMLALAKKYFGNIPRQTLLPQKPAVYQAPLGKRIVNVSLPAKVENLLMSYNVPVLKTAKQRWQPYALAVLAEVLAGSDSSRFNRDLIRGKQVAASVDASYDPTTRFNSLFTISAVPTHGNTVKQLQKAIKSVIKTLQQRRIPRQELTRIKTQLIANQIYQQDSITAQATNLGSLVSVGLPWQLASDYIKNIQRVTAKQVQQVAKLYLTNKRLTQGILHPLPLANSAESTRPMTLNNAGGLH